MDRTAIRPFRLIKFERPSADTKNSAFESTALPSIAIKTARLAAVSSGAAAVIEEWIDDVLVRLAAKDID